MHFLIFNNLPGTCTGTGWGTGTGLSTGHGRSTGTGTLTGTGWGTMIFLLLYYNIKTTLYYLYILFIPGTGLRTGTGTGRSKLNNTRKINKGFL